MKNRPASSLLSRLPLLLLVCWLLTPTPGRADILYVSNHYNDTVNTVGPGGSDGPGTVFASSGLSAPEGLSFDGSGNLYVANSGSGYISNYNSSGALINGQFASIGASGTYAIGLAFDSSGNLYVADTYGAISKVGPGGGTPTTFVPTAGLNGPIGLAFDTSGTLYVSNGFSTATTTSISKVTPTGVVTPLSLSSPIGSPYGLAFDSSGNLYVSNIGSVYNAGQTSAIYEVTPSGTVSTFINGGAGLNDPTGLAFDSSGNLYVANYGSNTISEYSGTGTLINSSFASGFNDPEFLAFSTVPEPSTFALLAGIAALGFVGWRRR
jgi:sugar lactone lactonase YvrE